MHGIRRAITLAIGLVALLSLAACASGATTAPASSPSAAAVTSSSPSPSPVATPTPTPTPTPWSSDKAAAVVGSIDCGTVTKSGVEQTTTPPYTLTGQVNACTATLSDPRVTGTGSIVLNTFPHG